MQLRDYARAIATRWGWAAAAGAIGLVLVTGLGAATPRTYGSGATLYVGAARVGAVDDDPGYAAQVQQVVLPSLAALTRSTGVTAEVARTVGAPLTAARLAGEVTATTAVDTADLRITVTDRDPALARRTADALAAEVQREGERLYPATGGSLLSITVLGPADPATWTGGGVSATRSLLAALAAAALAAVAAGLAELRRPRVHGAGAAARLLGLPAVALPAPLPARRGRARGADAPVRSEQRVVVSAQLQAWAGSRSADRLAVLGTGAAALAAELPPTGPVRLVPVEEPALLSADGPVDGAVLLVDARHDARAGVLAAADAARASGVPLVGVVVDGLVPAAAGARGRLRAGLRGTPVWSRNASGWETAGTGRGDTLLPRAVALVAMAALGFTTVLPFALSTGLLAAVALAPLWLPFLRRSRGATALAGTALLALVSGLLLRGLSSADHAFELHTALRSAVLVLTAVGGVGLLLWARSLLPDAAVAAAYGAGYLVAGVLAVPGATYVWKFALSAPVSIIVLSLAVASRRTPVAVAALGVLGVVDVLEDARSALGFCVLAAVLVLWQARASRPGAAGGRPRRWTVVPVLGGLVVGAYLSLTNLIESGLLGEQLQQRTAVQIGQSGSLLLSGRPEWAATWALMRDHPWGFGLGILPSDHDEAVARAGLAVTHVPTVDSYLDHVLFDGGIQLHSIVADLWAACGPLGVVLGLLVALHVVLGLGGRLASRRASALLCWLVPQVLWSLAFGPLSSDIPAVVLALGLLLPVPALARAARPAAPAPAPGPEPAVGAVAR